MDLFDFNDNEEKAKPLAERMRANSMEELAKKNLDDCKLYSPYSGVLLFSRYMSAVLGFNPSSNSFHDWFMFVPILTKYYNNN